MTRRLPDARGRRPPRRRDGSRPRPRSSDAPPTRRPAPVFFRTLAVDARIERLARAMDPRVLARWSIECADRVLPWFERRRPNDPRPAVALAVARHFARTGSFRMAVVRAASLGAHAAAREVEDRAAKFAARAAGHAVATAHVRTHSLVAALYAASSQRAARPSDPGRGTRERNWQLRRLEARRAGSRRPPRRSQGVHTGDE